MACGPGRVARLLARRGWKLTGLDRSAAMLALAHEQASLEATPLATLCADVTAFSAPEPFAAAYNPLSSFRLLQRDTEGTRICAAWRGRCDPVACTCST